jgi:hypothetical protein
MHVQQVYWRHKEPPQPKDKDRDKDKPPRFPMGRPEDVKDADKKAGIESALNRNLIELSIHAAAAFYERYPPKSAAPAVPPGRP